MDFTMDYNSEEFQRAIEPFKFISGEEQCTLSLDIDDGYLADLFRIRETDGFVGSGYDWEALAEVFLAEVYNGDDENFEFESETGAFIVYSEDGDALSEFALAFKEVCEDRDRIEDLFSRAQLQ